MSGPTAGTGSPPLLWEQHCCLPLSTSARLGELLRYSRCGGAYVSVNVASGPTSAAATVELLAHFRRQIEAHPALAPARTTADIERANRNSSVVVAFDLEDSTPLEGDPARVQQFYDLGVRTMLPTYNRRNAAGGGCLDEIDEGLTGYGQVIVEAMNEVGMVVDGSHCGERTGLDLSDVSAKPMVYSHSCMRSLHDHPRNITDEQARRCAAVGGVIGIAGVRHMLGTRGPLTSAMVEHVRYLVDLVGPEHAGLATDYVFDQAGLLANIAAHPERYPETDPPRGPDSYMPPEGLLRMQDELSGCGLSDGQIAGVLGGNFRRVAEAVWT